MKKKLKTEKIYDLADLHDHTVSVGTKLDARKLGLFTRSVHIWLFNKQSEIMVSKRSKNVKSYPNQITSSAGGHVEKGESYKIAAVRELKEELGIKTSLKDSGRFDVITSKERAIHHLFIGKANKEISLNLYEIAGYHFLSLNKLIKDIASHPRKYAKPFHEALKHYLKLR